MAGTGIKTRVNGGAVRFTGLRHPDHMLSLQLRNKTPSGPFYQLSKL